MQGPPRSPFPPTQGTAFNQPEEEQVDHIISLAQFIQKLEQPPGEQQPLLTGPNTTTKLSITNQDSLIRVIWGVIPTGVAFGAYLLGSTAFTANLFVLAVLAAFFQFRKKSTDWKAIESVDMQAAQYNMSMKVYLPFSASALVSFAFLFLYFKFVSWGPTILRVQIPTEISFIRFILWAVYFAGLQLLAVLEVYFYSYVLFLKLHMTLPHQAVCAALYGLYHFVWIYKALDGFFWILFVTLFMLGFSWILLVAVRRECFLKALAMRLGVTVGVTLSLIFLIFTTDAIGAPKGNLSPFLFMTRG